MNFKILYELLSSKKWYNETEEIEILKGKYNLTFNGREMIEKSIRKYKFKK